MSKLVATYLIRVTLREPSSPEREIRERQVPTLQAIERAVRQAVEDEVLPDFTVKAAAERVDQ